MKYGLKPEQLEEIRTRLSAFPDIESAFLFGSRAMGTYKQASDIDIALKGELDKKTLIRLGNAFEDSDLPFFVDLVDYVGITEPALKQSIDTYGIQIYPPATTNEWRQTTLGNIASIQTGPFGSQLHASDYVPVGIPSIMPTNIGSKLDIKQDSIVHIAEEDAIRLERYRVKENDIVYSRRGDVEKCAFISKEQEGWLCGTGCLRVRFTSNQISPKFCAYYLSTEEVKGWVSGNAVGTTMPNLNSAILQRLPLLLPPFIEQEAIASVLSSLDDKIDLLHRQNKTLEAMAETLFRQWFVEGAEDDWEERHLLSWGEIICGKTPSKTNPQFFGGEIPFIKIPDMHGKTYIFHTQDSLTKEGKGSQRNKIIPAGSICVSCIATVGLVSMTTIESQTNQQINSIIPYKNESRYFLYLYMKSSFDLLHAMASGGTATLNLNTGNFANIIAPFPGDTLLSKFHTIVDPIFRKIFKNQQQVRTLEKLRDTLLPKLMSGEVRVKLEAAA